MTDHYAKGAQRLMQDDAFAEAYARLRKEAIDALIEATGETFIRCQERVKALDSIPAELENAMRSLSESANGFDPNQRPDPSAAVN